MIRYVDLKELVFPIVLDCMSKYYGKLTNEELSVVSEMLETPTHTCAAAIVVSKRGAQLSAYPILTTMLSDISHLTCLDISSLCKVSPGEAKQFLVSYGVGDGRLSGTAFPWLGGSVVLSILGIGNDIRVLVPVVRARKKEVLSHSE